MKTGRLLLVAWAILSVAWIAIVAFYGWAIFDAVAVTTRLFTCGHCTPAEAARDVSISTGWLFVIVHFVLPSLVVPFLALALGIGIRKIAAVARRSARSGGSA